ncbi:hypothetical protein [Murimonas intestini]|uniref:hypothetical protein n=1 Tax=Murimonas intestini TaxID=1337051 RepID=UPI00214B61E2|nr:hypothetical protein [Murimonas intestini]MCR1839940.1 hypothetical protein [Murimonas intestini]MCR1866780.1 hypothetical protein [Murimonas intestini]MCR1883613.1 hypothetical protein [Murimonas intestini]
MKKRCFPALLTLICIFVLAVSCRQAREPGEEPVTEMEAEEEIRNSYSRQQIGG